MTRYWIVIPLRVMERSAKISSGVFLCPVYGVRGVYSRWSPLACSVSIKIHVILYLPWCRRAVDKRSRTSSSHDINDRVIL
jgi:hypothetical protein